MHRFDNRDEISEFLRGIPADGAHRQHPAGPSQGILLCQPVAAGLGGVTQTNWPPKNPVWLRDEIIRIGAIDSGSVQSDSHQRF